ncbi:tannase/feruloyl esterase family alpha/beta hydrolase [Micromonospora sp. LZ34]
MCSTGSVPSPACSSPPVSPSPGRPASPTPSHDSTAPPPPPPESSAAPSATRRRSPPPPPAPRRPPRPTATCGPASRSAPTAAAPLSSSCIFCRCRPTGTAATSNWAAAAASAAASRPPARPATALSTSATLSPPTDTSHVGGGSDASFALDNTAAQNTWGYLSEHLTALAARALLKGMINHAPAYAYFVGCSTGGRQALVEAQRWPGDFDGLVAGTPANRQNYLAPLSQGVREQQNRDADDRQIVDAAAAAVANQGVQTACDGVVKDGVVDDPRACRFDPATLLCPGGAANRRDCRVHRAEDQPARHYLTQPDVVAGLDQYVDNLIAVCNGV